TTRRARGARRGFARFDSACSDLLVIAFRGTSLRNPRRPRKIIPPPRLRFQGPTVKRRPRGRAAPRGSAVEPALLVVESAEAPGEADGGGAHALLAAADLEVRQVAGLERRVVQVERIGDGHVD